MPEATDNATPTSPAASPADDNFAEAPAPELNDTLTTQPEAGAEALPEPAPSPASPAAQPGLTPEALAQANYQTFGPLFQQLMPKPPEAPLPWADPKSFWSIPAEGDGFYKDFHSRQEQLARHIAQAWKPMEIAA